MRKQFFPFLLMGINILREEFASVSANCYFIVDPCLLEGFVAKGSKQEAT